MHNQALSGLGGTKGPGPPLCKVVYSKYTGQSSPEKAGAPPFEALGPL